MALSVFSVFGIYYSLDKKLCDSRFFDSSYNTPLAELVKDKKVIVSSNQKEDFKKRFSGYSEVISFDEVKEGLIDIAESGDEYIACVHPDDEAKCVELAKTLYLVYIDKTFKEDLAFPFDMAKLKFVCSEQEELGKDPSATFRKFVRVV